MTVTVTPVNDPPVAVADTASTQEDIPIVTANVRTNDTDVDGDTLSVMAFTQPSQGSAVDNGNGTFTYTPAAGFYGQDTFTYTVSDGHSGMAVATVTVTVNGTPVAGADTARTRRGVSVTTPDVLANDSDPEGDAPTISAFTQAAHGSVVNNGDGTFTYAPVAGFAGKDAFTYTISDGHGGTAVATVSIRVNGPPVAVNDTASTQQNVPMMTSNVLAKDTDPNDDTLSVSAFDPPAHGSVAYNGNGTFTYTPEDDFVGQDSFTYTVSDGDGGISTASVTVNVLTPNPNPTVVIDGALSVLAGAQSPDQMFPAWVATNDQADSGSLDLLAGSGAAAPAGSGDAGLPGLMGAASYGNSTGDGGGALPSYLSSGVSAFLAAAPPAQTGYLLATLEGVLRSDQGQYGSSAAQPAAPENAGSTGGIVVATPASSSAPMAADDVNAAGTGEDVLEAAPALAIAVLQGTAEASGPWEAKSYLVAGIIGAASGVVSGVAAWMVRSRLAPAPVVIHAHPQRMIRRPKGRKATRGSRWQQKKSVPQGADATADIHEPMIHGGGPPLMN